jgi:hypothetical protein
MYNWGLSLFSVDRLQSMSIVSVPLYWTDLVGSTQVFLTRLLGDGQPGTDYLSEWVLPGDPSRR